MKDIEDRRRTGVNRVRILDGNGGKLDVYTLTAQRFRVWFGCVIAILTVCGMVFTAARFGVGVEIHQAIEAEAVEETGVIHREIRRCTEEYIDEVVEVIQDDMALFETQQQQQNELGIRLEERQIALISKVDGQHLAVIQAIQDAGNSS